MLCLDSSIIVRKNMLQMFDDLSKKYNNIITDQMIADYGGKYMRYYERYISQLNLIDECITINKMDKQSWYVKVNYLNIEERGIYAKLLKMRNAYNNYPILNYLSNKEICVIFSIPTKAVQMFKGYYTCASDNLPNQKLSLEDIERLKEFINKN